MMTSRAEYRLLLRQDNADLRLRKYGYRVGLIDEETYYKTCEKQRLIESEIRRLEETHIGTSETLERILNENNSPLLKSGCSLADLIRRPELDYDKIYILDVNCDIEDKSILEQANIEIKYEGYIKRQQQQVNKFKNLENKKIPENFDYDKVPSLKVEALQNLKKFRPVSLGQASRISGITPSDISVLMVYLKSK